MKDDLKEIDMSNKFKKFLKSNQNLNVSAVTCGVTDVIVLLDSRAL